MLHVAIRAERRERLVGVMDRPIVASQAGLVGGTLLVTGLRDMARAAFLSKQRVCVGKRSGVVGLRTSRHGVPAEPRQAHDHEYARENPPPARNTTQRLEVIQIDALSEFLGGAYASGHLIGQC